MILYPFNLLRRYIYVKAQEASSDERLPTKGKVVIGGGTGFVGSELCRLLRRNDYEVVVVSRSKTAPGSSAHRIITWDELAESGLPVGTKAVVNLAGHNILDPLKRWTPHFQQLVYSSRINTAKDFRDAIVRCEAGSRPKVFVQVTGVGYYPPSKTAVYDEESAGGNHDFLAKLVGDLEGVSKMPKEISECDHVRNVWIRSGVVLGRGGGLIGNIFWQFFFGLGGRMGTGTQPFPWIHVKDIAELIKYSIENENVEGILNGVAPQLIDNKEFAETFASTLSRPCLIPTPEFIWKLVFGPERATIVIDGQKVDPKRTLETGFKFRFPTIDKACQEFSQVFYKDADEL